MDEATMRRALKADLTANGYKVLLALALGYTEVYDIQRATNLKRHRVDAVAQNVQSVLTQKRKRKETIGTLVPSAQIVQHQSTPPRSLTGHLYKHLSRPLPRDPREWGAIKQMYVKAYEGPAQKDQEGAVNLVLDCIEVNVEKVRKAELPMLYMQKIFSTYLSAMPKMPLHIWEVQQARGKRMRYNNLTNNWEKQECNLTMDGPPSANA